jgi:TatD DNase family protein
MMSAMKNDTGYIDFHCHLDDREFDGTRRDLINSCFEAGFSRLVTVSDPFEKESIEKTKESISIHENVFGTVAVHPHHADHYNDQLEKRIISFLENKKIIALGETGLDFYYNHSTPDNQSRAFKRQISIAKELSLPLVIHARQAEDLVLKILEEEKFTMPVVFHCYSGSQDQAEEILKRGYYFSFSGIVTFPKAEGLRDIVRTILLDRIFTETDSPYLSPHPFRGKTNSPLRVKLVAEKIAEIKNITIPELNRAVNQNFNRLFSEKLT